MATRTGKVGSYDWSSTGSWEEGAVPANGDIVVLPNGCVMRFDVDQSGFANGGGLLTVNAGGIFHVKASVTTYLKMNANVDVNGAFYIAERATVSSFTPTENRTNVYQAARTLATYSVEETLGVPYLAAYNEVMEAAITAENSKRLNEQLIEYFTGSEMMADEVISFIEEMRAELTLNDYLDYVEDNPGSYYHDSANNLLYIHTSDSTNPSGKTITGIEPINRPTAGTENRCTIMFNTTGVFTNTGGGTPILQAYGWHPEREWTQLSANAASGQNQIVLTHDMDLQQGDIISIGSGTEYGNIAEALKGVYTVSSYVAETKTVTLSANLQTNRLSADLVLRVSRPIKLIRSSSGTAFIGVQMDVLCNGIYASTIIYSGTSTAYVTGGIFRHCSIKTTNSLIKYVNGFVIEDSLNVGAGYIASYSVGTINRCGIIYSGAFSYYGAGTIENSISENNLAPVDIQFQGIIKNCTLKNMTYINGSYYPCTFKNCSFKCEETLYHRKRSIGIYEDCTFENNTSGYFNIGFGELYNCLFADEGIKTTYMLNRAINEVLESFDHNGIIGNYYTLCKGGTIETLFTDGVVQPGHLIFKPASSLYPVFRDIPITVQEGRIHQYRITAMKDFTGGTIKAEIIGPANDPLVDTSALPLVVEYLPDIADLDEPIDIRYRATQTQQLILRLSVINATGNVYFDPVVSFEKFRRKELI